MPSYENSNGFFTELGKKPKICMEAQKTTNSKRNPK